MALKDILNQGKYADDIVLSLPDGTTATVGEMRSVVTDRENIVNQAELALASKVQQAMQAGWLSQDGRIVPPPTPRSDREIRQHVAVETGLDENDPLFGQTVKAFKEELGKRDQQIEAMKNEFGDALKKITGVVQTAVGANLEERYQGEFSRATKDLPSGVKVDYETAFKYANENGLKDKYGRLDINSAVDRLTWEDRKKAEMERIQQEAKADAEKRTAMANVNRPRTSNPAAHREKTDFNPVNEKGRVKSFDEALAEASNDDALIESALATASFGVVQ